MFVGLIKICVSVKVRKEDGAGMRRVVSGSRSCWLEWREVVFDEVVRPTMVSSWCSCS